MKKYYKVYANCCIAAKAIKEIDKEDAKGYVIDAVDRYIDNQGIGDLEPFHGIDLDEDDDDAVNAAWEKVYDKAIALDKEERSAKMSTNSCNCLIQ